MNWTIKASSRAEKYYKRLDEKTRKRIKKELIALSESDNPIDYKHVKPLTGDLKGFYRLRIGDYRIVFSIIEEIRTIAVVNIAPRGNVYK